MAKNAKGTVLLEPGKRRVNTSTQPWAVFEKVRRADGRIGHLYADGKVVWLTEAMTTEKRRREALRRSKRSKNAVGGAAAPALSSPVGGAAAPK